MVSNASLCAMCDAVSVSYHTFADEDVDAALALPCSNSKGCMHAQSIFCLLASIQSKRRCLTLPAHAYYTMNETYTCVISITLNGCVLCCKYYVMMNHTVC